MKKAGFKKWGLFVIGLAAIGGEHAAMASCGAAFCSVSTNWDVQGVPNTPGSTRLSLRYEYIDQDQLRAGKQKVSASQTTAHVAELETINRNWLATIDHTIDTQWGISMTLPHVSRNHSHIEDPEDHAEFERWKYSRLGDMRVVGRYQFGNASTVDTNAGVQFGVKLPTGEYRIANADGVVAERTLQPGTGSADLIAGLYYSRAAEKHQPGWFIEGTYQRAVVIRDGYRPGDQLSFTGGVTYPATANFSILAQINALHKQRDTGSHAENESSGGKYVNISPGLSAVVNKHMQLYGYWQLPLYSKVNGTQLTTRQGVVFGASMTF